jgi:hypothetical protein
MFRSWKMLATVLATVALSAAVAPGAWAGTGRFDAEAGAALTGSQLEQVKIHFGTVGILRCTALNLSGTAVGVSQETQTVTPAFNGCNLAGNAVSVVLHGCDLVFNAGSSFLGLVEINCTGTNRIEVKFNTGSACKILFGPQSMAGVTYANPSANHVKFTLNLANLGYNVNSSAECPNSPTVGEHNDGAIEGSLEMTGNMFKVTA